MKFKDMEKVILDEIKVLGITHWDNIEFSDEDKQNFKQLDWEAFNTAWLMHKLKKPHKEKYSFDYISDAKKIIEGLGYNFKNCTFYWSLIDAPLLISVAWLENPIVVAISPRMYGNDKKG